MFQPKLAFTFSAFTRPRHALAAVVAIGALGGCSADEVSDNSSEAAATVGDNGDVTTSEPDAFAPCDAAPINDQSLEKEFDGIYQQYVGEWAAFKKVGSEGKWTRLKEYTWDRVGDSMNEKRNIVFVARRNPPHLGAVDAPLLVDFTYDTSSRTIPLFQDGAVNDGALRNVIKWVKGDAAGVLTGGQGKNSIGDFVKLNMSGAIGLAKKCLRLEYTAKRTEEGKNVETRLIFAANLNAKK